MKKIAIILTALILVSVSLAEAANDKENAKESPVATTTITGQVFDKITGEALAGVKVSIAGTEKSVYTDFDGNFEIKEVLPGEVEIFTSYISYKKKVEKLNIDLKKNNKIDVKIESLTK